MNYLNPKTSSSSISSLAAKPDTQFLLLCMPYNIMLNLSQAFVLQNTFRFKQAKEENTHVERAIL